MQEKPNLLTWNCVIEFWWFKLYIRSCCFFLAHNAFAFILFWLCPKSLFEFCTSLNIKFSVLNICRPLWLTMGSSLFIACRFWKSQNDGNVSPPQNRSVVEISNGFLIPKNQPKIVCKPLSIDWMKHKKMCWKQLRKCKEKTWL